MMTRRLLASWLLVFLLSSVPGVIRADTDTDGDGIPDSEEDLNGNRILDDGETDPYNADSDGGGESDGSEIRGKRNPLDPLDDLTADPDGDGWVNGVEIEHRTDPKNVDTDNDTVPDPKDPFPLDARYSTDTNTNQLPDEWEAQYGLLGLDVATTREDDPDGDGLKNAQEFALGTNPVSADTDRDGTDDKTEVDEGTTPAENACLKLSENQANLSDLSEHWAENVVRSLARITVLPSGDPIVRGYDENGTSVFLPDRSVTRYEFLKMTMLSTCTKLWNTALPEKPVFTDIREDAPINENDETALKRRIVYSAVRYDIVQGYEDGTFRPDATVNRAEALKILSLAARFEIPRNGSGTVLTFTDVSPDDWFSPYVTDASRAGIVGGYGDGTFRPGNPITRAEAAKIIKETILRNPSINGYILLDIGA